jgi:uncharacterized DUF497 family protein
MADFSRVIGFDWDEGNARKNERHGVTQAEAEQVFFNFPLLALSDLKHSEAEPRFHALGTTHEGRRLHLTFTLRNEEQLIHVISARHAPKRASDL